MSSREIVEPVSKISFLIRRRKPKPSIVYDTYWRFAVERQSIFFKRLNGELPPWTSDSILRIFKFTNPYRACDRTSQFLIREIILKGNQEPRELLFRILLFKLFNKIETWQALVRMLNEVSYETYTFYKYDKVLRDLRSKGQSIYSGAYIMASGKSNFGNDFKHQNHLILLEMIMKGLSQKIQDLNNMQSLFNDLKIYPTIGNFLAYQLATDINYSDLTNFSEMEFVKAGPGANDGIRKCFIDLGDYSEEDTIRMMTEAQEDEFDRLGLKFQTLWGRPLQLIDCQNLFCEVDKYSRVAHPEVESVSKRVRIKQKFRPTSLKPVDLSFPPKWNLNVPRHGR